MSPGTQDIIWLEDGVQRLGLLPGHGGSVAAWDWRTGDGWLPLWCSWDGRNPDLYAQASFPMLPWVNRISQGGFEHQGRHHSVALTRADEPYPIHGVAWLHPWTFESPAADSARLSLSVAATPGQPWSFDAEQRFTLRPDGLLQRIELTLRGEHSMPCGLGVHPWFPRTPRMQVQAQVAGIWWREPDGILPREQLAALPPGFDLRQGLQSQGPKIDHVYYGWDGNVTLTWPEHQLALHVQQTPLEAPHGQLATDHLVVYRPQGREVICVEPQSQAIDAFHLPGHAGLVVLEPGEKLAMQVHWRIAATG